MASAGSAVGLGNIWKFPYVTGENGGGAFVLVYLIAVLFVGIPIMMSEVLMGREGRKSPINSLRDLVERSKTHPLWTLIAWSGALAGFLILSFYSVIAGWTLYYVGRLFSGYFVGASQEFSVQAFEGFSANVWMQVGFHTLFLALTVVVVARGVNRGLEFVIKWFMPLLFLILIGLLVYSVGQDGFGEAVRYLFRFDLGALGVDGVLAAIGQAFFSLSLGMAALMAYGAYVPRNVQLGSTIGIIALLDTAVAIAAGLIIFSIVFTHGLEADEGAGLMFVTLPLAFGKISIGAFVGGIFFVLVSIAALTSIISLMEPALAWVVEEYNARRARVAMTVGFVAWILGLGTAFSFNIWADFHIVGGLTFFGFVDYVASNIMLPLGGMLIALFAGWILPRKIVREQLRLSPGAFQAWLWTVRVVAPLAVFMVFLYKIGQSLG